MFRARAVLILVASSPWQLKFVRWRQTLVDRLYEADFLRATVVVPGVLRWRVDFWKIFAPTCVYVYVIVCLYVFMFLCTCVCVTHVSYVFLCQWTSFIIDVLPLCGRLILDVVMKLQACRICTQ